MADRYDVVVVGAGPGGIAAAIAARDAGAERVLLVDRDQWLGGILKQCVHAGFGAYIFDAELTGPEYAERYVQELGCREVELALRTSVLSIHRDRTLVLCSSEGGLRSVQAGAVVLAMGCRERTRGNVNIPGSRPAGIFTAGTAQRLINVDGLEVGRDIVIIGSGDVGLIMARRCVLEGANVRAVIERLPFPGGCTRNVVQCLDDFGIPLYLSHAVTFIHGRQRVEGVSFAPVDTDGGQGSERGSGYLACDTLLLSIGLIPEVELAKQLSIPLDPNTGGPVVDSNMQTRQPGVFACGNLVQVYDVVDWVSVGGERAGRGAARFAKGKLGVAPCSRVRTGKGVKSIAPHYLCHDGEPDLMLYCRVDARYRNARFLIRSGGRIIGQIDKDFAVPSEMVNLDLAPLASSIARERELHIEIEGTRMTGIYRGPTAGSSLTGSATGAERRISCIVCPSSCLVRVSENNGELLIKGATCKKGLEYATQEYRDPRRVFTYTVSLRGGDASRLSVRSSRPIPKADWQRAVETASSVVVRAPIRHGQVVLSNFLEEGVDLVATRSADASDIR